MIYDDDEDDYDDIRYDLVFENHLELINCS